MIMLPLLFATMTVPLPAGFQPQTIATGPFGVALCGRSGQLLIVNGPPQTASCGQNPTAMIASGNDLVVPNHATDYIIVLHNDGHNHFKSETLHVHSKPHPHTVAAADLNGDKRIDLVTDSWAENRLTLLFAKAEGGWQTPGTTIDVPRKPYINVIATDLDGDGNVDLVMPNSGFDSVCILFGDGRGHFSAAPPIAAGPTPFMIAVADVNGDGRPDIIVANYSGHITDIANDGLTWLRNDGNRRFTAFRDRIPGRGTWRVAAGDLNGDGFADAAFINAADDTVTVAFGSKSGLRAGPTIHVMPHPHNLAIANGRIYVITEDRDQLAVVTP